MTETAHLKIGDYVHLKFIKLNGFLSAEGVLEDELYCDNNVEDFDDVLFQVQLQRQYSAAYELNLFSKRQAEAKAENPYGYTEDKRTTQFRNALVKGRDNEINMNESFMKERLGTSVCFGDVIQLLHVKSQKYISLLPGELARDERENMTAFLSPEGSADSWFAVMPRYKIDREGDVVPATTEVYLKLAEKSNEFLHCADKDPPKGLKREVNVALGIPTSWRMQIFRSAVDVMAKTNVMCGMPIVLNDPESNTFLSVCTPAVHLKTVRDVDLDIVMAEEQGELDSVMYDDGSVASAGDVEEFIEEYGDLVLMSMPRNDRFDTNAVWVVESKDVSRGGVVEWKTDTVRLRHYRTGKYLAVRHSKTLGFYTTYDRNITDTLVNITNISNNPNHLLQKNCAILLHKGHHYMQRGQHNDNMNVYTVRSTSHTTTSMNFILNEYTETEDGSVQRVNGLLQPMDLDSARTIKRFFERYLRKTAVPPQGLFLPGSDNVWPRQDVMNLGLFEHGVQTVVHFVTGDPMTIMDNLQSTDGEEEEKSGIDQLHSQKLRMLRQDILREQGVLDLLLTMLNMLVPVSLAREAAAERRITVNTVAFATVQAIVSSLLLLMYHCVNKNPENQFAVAEHLLIILGHVAMDRKAAEIVGSMLADNDEIQETKIGDEEINIFAQRMHDREMNVVYMKMLTSCCSCNGSAVVSNQQVVENIIFGSNSSLLISFVMDEANMVDNVFAASDSLYLKPLKGGFSSDAMGIMGKHLVERGVPVVKSTWSAFSDESPYVPKTLFGIDPVPINSVLRMRSVVPGKDSGKAHIAALRQHVLDFLRAQLLLSSEMCLGRNYPVMEAMEKDYSFELLMSLYLLGQDDETKQYVVMLILRLYVDRDPQRVAVIPRLTRTVNFVGEDRKLGVTSPRLPCVEDARASNFTLLQYIIREELSRVKGGHYRAHTHSIAVLMHKLLLFDFYGREEIMTDAITSIVEALDRRGMGVKSVAEGKAKSRRLSRRASLSSVKSSGQLSIVASNHTSATVEADEDENESKKDTWQAKSLNFLESSSFTIFMLFLVLVSLVVAGYQVVVLRDAETEEVIDDVSGNVTTETYDPDASLRDTLFWADLGIFVVFCIEWACRLYCFHSVHENVLGFFQDGFNVLDFIVIAIDAMLLAMSGMLAEAEDAGSFSKGLRMLRIAKVVRMFRLMKQMVNKGVRMFSKWKSPPRYLSSPADDIKTMNELTATLRRYSPNPNPNPNSNPNSNPNPNPTRAALNV